MGLGPGQRWGVECQVLDTENSSLDTTLQKEICTRVLSGRLSVSDAANSVISELKLLGADAGVIVIDHYYGSAAMIYNTPAMARAYKNSNGDEEVSIYDYKQIEI